MPNGHFLLTVQICGGASHLYSPLPISYSVQLISCMLSCMDEDFITLENNYFVGSNSFKG